MQHSKLSRKLLAALGSAALVFVQTAMAAQACMLPFTAGTESSMAASQPSSGAAPCHEMDGGGSTNPCAQRCNAPQISLDHHQPGSAAPVLIAICQVDLSDQRSLPQSTRSYSHALLTRATAPPLSVRNCCFRI
jgi:hypothetical protein